MKLHEIITKQNLHDWVGEWIDSPEYPTVEGGYPIQLMYYDEFTHKYIVIRATSVTRNIIILDRSVAFTDDNSVEALARFHVLRDRDRECICAAECQCIVY